MKETLLSAGGTSREIFSILMQGNLKYINILLAIFIMFLISCTNNSYSLVARNIGDQKIENVEIAFGNGFFRPGTLSPSVSKVLNQPGFRVPNQATVTWENNNKQFSEHVDVAKHLPRNFSGRIFFDISSNENSVGIFLWNFPGDGPPTPRPGQDGYTNLSLQ